MSTGNRYADNARLALNTYRNLILSFDVSALGIQASQLIAANVGGAIGDIIKGDTVNAQRRADALSETLQAAGVVFNRGSDKRAIAYENAMAKIENSKLYEISQNLDIRLEIPGLTEGVVTEEFDKSFLDKIWLTQKVKEVSQQTFDATIAMSRFKAFELFYLNNPHATKEQLSDIADFINTRSGAGKFSILGKSGEASPLLNAALIAPRLYYSTFKSLYWMVKDLAKFANSKRKGDKENAEVLRFRALETMNTIAGFVGFHMVMAAVVSLGSSDEEDYTSADDNPVGSSFLGIRSNDFSMNSSYLIPYMRLFTKMLGQTSYFEEKVDNKRPDNLYYTGQNGKDMLYNFLKYKVTPFSSILLTGLKNEDAIKRPINVKTGEASFDRYGTYDSALGEANALGGTAYNYMTTVFPLPIAIRGAFETVASAVGTDETSKNNKAKSKVSKIANKVTGTLLNFVGVSGHTMDNQIRSVYSSNVFKTVGKRIPGVNTNAKDFPQIFKKTDLNGDANALGHYLADHVQNEIGSWLVRSRARNKTSIDQFAQLSDKKKEAFVELVKAVKGQATKYHMTRMTDKYKLTTVPKGYLNKHEINWEAFDTRLDNLLKVAE